MTIHKLALLTLFILFSLKGNTQSLKLKPEIGHVYDYNSELILEENSSIAFMINFDFDLKYTNKNHDFDIVLRDIKGSMNNNYKGRRYFNSNQNNPDDDELKQLLDNVIGKPLSFKVDKNGFAHKNYSLNIGNAGIETVLNQLTNKFGSKKVNPLKNITLKKGYTWSESDSISFKKDQSVNIITSYTITEVNNKEVIVEYKGSFEIDNNTIQMGGISIYERKTGIQLLTKLMLNFERESNMYMLSKLKGYDYPELILDYQELTYKKAYNNWYSKDDQPDYAKLSYHPLQRVLSSSFIEDYKSTLQVQHANDKYESISVYNMEGDSLFPIGTYAEVDAFYIDTDTGKKPLKLIPGMEDFDSFSLGYLGEYYQSMYEPIPQGDSISIEMSMFIPSESKNLEISRQKPKNKNIKVTFNNDAVLISFPKKEYKSLIFNFHKAIRFYDKENKEIPGSYNFLYNQNIKTGEPYTPKELIDIFSDKVNTGPIEDIELEFKVKNADKVSIDTYSNFEKHDLTITKEIMH